MKYFKKLMIYLLILTLSLLSISCTKGQKKPQPKSETGPKEVPPVIEEIETDIISIMENVDLIPYYEKEIGEKKKKEEEKKQLEILIGKKPSTEDTSKEQGGDKGGDGKGGESDSKESEGQKKEGQMVEFKPKPITIKDTILSDLLKEEKAKEEDSKSKKEVPDDIIMIWNDINSKVKGLHEKWNSLEPELIKAGGSQDAIKNFEDTLNNLTISSTNYKYMDTLMLSNKLTSYIPSLTTNFKSKIPNQIYHMKYYIRQIVLDSSNNNFNMSNSNFKKMLVYKDTLISQLAEKKLSELANKLNTSIADLQDVLKTKDMSVIKIKSSVVMKNLNEVKEKMSK